jgi:hypothetical protein
MQELSNMQELSKELFWLRAPCFDFVSLVLSLNGRQKLEGAPVLRHRSIIIVDLCFALRYSARSVCG